VGREEMKVILREIGVKNSSDPRIKSVWFLGFKIFRPRFK